MISSSIFKIADKKVYCIAIQATLMLIIGVFEKTEPERTVTRE